MMKRFVRCSSVLILMTVWLAVPFAQAENASIAIMNGTVHTVSEDGVLEGGDILIENGAIANVGGNLRPIGDPAIIDARGKVVTPGFFSALTGIGLEEISLDFEANDVRPDESFDLGAALDASLAFNSRTTVVPVTRAGGVTHAFVTSLPGSGLFGGQGFVAAMSGGGNAVQKAQVAQFVSIGYGGAYLESGTRIGVWAVLSEYLTRARNYADDSTAYRRDAKEDRFSLSDIAALAPVLDKEQKLVVAAHRADDILRAVKMAQKFDLEVVILGGAEAWQVGAQLAAARVPVVLDPLQNLPSKFERMGATLENAARLSRAGVKIAFYDSDLGFTHNARLLPQLAGNAIAHGLDYEVAMAAVTKVPAEIFGLDAQMGSIEAGKQANVVIWDGDPFEVTTRPEIVIINGQVMPLETRQTKLRDRYRDLERRDLPPAYVTP